MEKVNISIKAYEAPLVDEATKKIVEIARAEKAKISGPVAMPTHREVFTVLRSPHLEKKAREQFEIRTHKRLIVISEVSPKLLDGLKRLEMPAGVEFSIKIK